MVASLSGVNGNGESSVAAKRQTGYCWHSLFGWATFMDNPWFQSDPAAGIQPGPHLADPQTKRRAHELIEVSGLLDHLVRVPAAHATKEQITRCHTEAHHDKALAVSEAGGGDLGGGATFIGKGGYPILTMATGSTCAMVDAVLSGTVDNGYALVHYPGHHAEPSEAMGYCTFNNCGVAAQHAIDKWGIKRVAIVDIDVHHGNGVEKIFWDRKDVLTVSIHQKGCFPLDTGAAEDRGAGAGKGYNINIPILPGSGNATYFKVLQEIVVPALVQFKPELIIVPCGLDPGIMDTFSRTMVTLKGFRQIAQRLLAVAEEVCGGKIVFSQEGGYSPVYVPFCIEAIIEELSGVKLLKDPHAWVFEDMFGVNDLTPWQEAHINEVKAIVLPVPQD